MNREENTFTSANGLINVYERAMLHGVPFVRSKGQMAFCSFIAGPYLKIQEHQLKPSYL
jgi:hypothetical protein